ncbi:hypothetical protein ACER0C_001361 [Sarotherodon galilaeus]
MRVAWQKGVIPKAWRRAGGILIPKEKNSSSISQFCQISLLNIEGKIFFSVLAQRLSTFLQRNNYINTSEGFQGLLELSETSLSFFLAQSSSAVCSINFAPKNSMGKREMLENVSLCERFSSSRPWTHPWPPMSRHPARGASVSVLPLIALLPTE